MFYPDKNSMGGDGVNIVGLFQIIIEELLVKKEENEGDEEDDD